jgi:hypothetical protein
VLSSQGNWITYLDKYNKLTQCSLSEVLAAALCPNELDPAQAKFIQRLVEKLRYCKEVLQSIHNADSKRELQETDDSAEGAVAVNTRTRIGNEAHEASDGPRNALVARTGQLDAAREARTLSSAYSGFEAGVGRSRSTRIPVR